MADIAISDLPAVSASADSDIVPIVQAGTTKRATLAQMLAAVNAAITGLQSTIDNLAAADVGADTAGSAAAVQTNLDTLTAAVAALDYSDVGAEEAGAVSVHAAGANVHGTGSITGLADAIRLGDYSEQAQSGAATLTLTIGTGTRYTTDGTTLTLATETPAVSKEGYCSFTLDNTAGSAISRPGIDVSGGTPDNWPTGVFDCSIRVSRSSVGTVRRVLTIAEIA